MSAEERRVPLTVNDILHLVGLVDCERERIRRMIDQHPSERVANELSHDLSDVALRELR